MAVTFTVAYVGQARYTDCLAYHSRIIQGHQGSCVRLIRDLREHWDSRIPSDVQASWDPQFKPEDLDSRVQTLTQSSDLEFYRVEQDLAYLAARPECWFFWCLTRVPPQTADFLAVMTTDLVYDQSSPTWQDQLAQEPADTLSWARAHIDRPGHMRTFQFCLSKAAHRWVWQQGPRALLTYLEEEDSNRGVEAATYRLLNLCGVSVKSGKYLQSVYRFRSNMDPDRVRTGDLQGFDQLARDYSQQKAQRCEQFYRQEKCIL